MISIFPTAPMDTAAAYLRWIRDLAHLRATCPEREGSAVMIFLFHGLFRSRREVDSKVCDPQQRITVAFFAEFVESLLAHGIAIHELEDALRQPRRGVSAVITFDDGYFNNVHALGVLEQFGVPATFFISTKHVEAQRAFWWDAVYREASKRGTTTNAIRRQVRALKHLRADEIESRIAGWFGSHALMPVSDGDRPFTAAELTDFARSRNVFLGNHTSDHAILVNYEGAGMRDQIEEAQRFLTRISGAIPRSIAFPNGQYDSRVLESARDAGLEFGLTIRPGLNVTATQQPMELRRLTVWGVPGAARQGSVLGSLAGNGSRRSGAGCVHPPARQ